MKNVKETGTNVDDKRLILSLRYGRNSFCEVDLTSGFKVDANAAPEVQTMLTMHQVVDKELLLNCMPLHISYVVSKGIMT